MKGSDYIYDQLVTLISSVGFPIVVSGYCLVTLNATMEKLTDAVTELTNTFNKGGKEDD